MLGAHPLFVYQRETIYIFVVYLKVQRRWNKFLLGKIKSKCYLNANIIYKLEFRCLWNCRFHTICDAKFFKMALTVKNRMLQKFTKIVNI